MATPEKFLKPYNPQETEKNIYKTWEESGFFNPDKCVESGKTEASAPTFSIVLPPPNVTGTLHMGHAAMLVIEDIMVRQKRMSGFRTLWIPGTDHAAIATQSKVEKEIYKTEGKSRFDLGREELLRRVNEFAQNSHDTIVSQVKTVGASLDWSREAYTLDKARHSAVFEAFKKMFDAGLIYRGHRIVNWDPKGQTTISDDEVEHEESKGGFYTFKYSKDFPIPIATTRPETKVGDTAVAVNPEDERYKQYIGQTFTVEFAGAKLSIKIVGDEAVDKDFGTGAVGVTPAHSQIDADIASRHDLPTIQVINEYAKMTENAGPLVAGLKTKEAREKIVEWIKTEGLLIKEEEITINISKAERTGGIIEPLPKLQWFVDVNKEFTIPHSNIPGIESGSNTTLKEIMRKAVSSGAIKIIPDNFEKIYFHWIDNLRDWCISRQIWFGHRIPVWYKGEEAVVSIEKPEGDGWTQDEDTLDTWFSSGLWTFSTLGWPEKTEDLKIYHPTAILETGYDILFFWVARMILMTGFCVGDVPFKTVYLHGLVRDGKGQKMSKSLGNIIDPVDMANKYGADATRMSLIIGNTPGTDIRLSEDKIKGYKHFANKLWNISRFIFENTEDISYTENLDNLNETDQKIKSEVDDLIEDVTSDIENYRLYMAGEKLYHFAWHRLADEILEESKKIFEAGESTDKNSRKQLLLLTLNTLIKMLHPFMPFVTEEIWSLAPWNKNGEILMVSTWPK